MKNINIESDALCASEIACAVADAWIVLGRSGWAAVLRGVVRTEKAAALGAALNRLELATRSSPLRKVRP
jgi:hypothetical protein